jgi:hypothetical protein
MSPKPGARECLFSAKWRRSDGRIRVKDRVRSKRGEEVEAFPDQYRAS